LRTGSELGVRHGATAGQYRTQGVKRKRVVGSVDPAGNPHFVYLLRKAGLALAPSAADSLYMSRGLPGACGRRRRTR
jgi:hypothetical protein